MSGVFQDSIDNMVEQSIDYPNEYPNIGFNPAPGAPADLDQLSKQVQSAADGLAQADTLLGELRSSSSSAWQGDAANAFRAHVSDNLAPDLEHAQQSLSKAVGVLSGWYSDLVANKQDAEQLDAAAARARQAQNQADTTLKSAMGDPGLALAGRYFSDQSEYLRAKATYQLAAGRLQQAESDSQVAANNLKAIIDKANALKQQHFAAASRAADDLRGCTNDLAPHKPGGLFHAISSAFSSAVGAVTGFVKKHLKQIHDVLSTISAISGLLALVTPPPADAIFGAVALVSGAGALAADVANPSFRKALLSGNPSAIITAVGDVASVIPGGGALAKSALKGGKDLTEGLSLASKAPGLAVKGLSKVPALVRVADKATGLDKVLQAGYDGASNITAIDRLNLLWKTKGVGSDIKKDIKDVVG